MSYLELIAGASLGVSIGLVLGVIISRKLGLTPSAREMAKALDENESYYKTMVSRLKGRMKEYEQPTDLQQLVGKMSGLPDTDAVGMLLNNLGGIKGIPGWIRPFLPGVMSYAKEHPEEVKALIDKFIKGAAKGSNSIEGDTL